MTRRAHYRTEQIALRLLHHISPAVVAALDALRREQSECDGWPNRGGSIGRGTGPTVYVEADDYEEAGRIPVTGVEAAAFTGTTVDNRAERINDTIESIEISVSHLARLVIGIDHTPAAGEERRCMDGQVGRDAVRWSSDTQCRELPVKLGMCEAHYRANLRWRQANHLPVIHYYEDGK